MEIEESKYIMNEETFEIFLEFINYSNKIERDLLDIHSQDLNKLDNLQNIKKEIKKESIINRTVKND